MKAPASIRATIKPKRQSVRHDDRLRDLRWIVETDQHDDRDAQAPSPRAKNAEKAA